MGKIIDKIKDGKFLAFVKDKFPDVLNTVGAITGIEQLKNIADLIDGNESISIEDKKLANELFKMELQELDSYLKDVQDARGNETKKDVSEHSTKLSKNIHEYIALLVVGGMVLLAFIITITYLSDSTLINLKDLKMLFEIFGLSGMVTLILGYMYGRSKPNE